ncbi:MAG TPA: methyltransferase domain-containing protein [Chloroflexota bacterium]|nr:methyltransferase domain-containing protein [Chloroflexota bacterium]
MTETHLRPTRSPEQSRPLDGSDGRGTDTSAFTFACPRCRAALVRDATTARCASCGAVSCQIGGIWDFLPAERAEHFATFLQDYETVRRAEGWGASEATYYRSLPYVTRSDPQRAIWEQRALAVQALEKRVLAPIEARSGKLLQIFDLGAGNGWLAARLARRGHQVAAVDLSTSSVGGLGARVHYADVAFEAVRAEFDRLPFADAQADLVVFDASFHYAAEFATTLREAQRSLRPGGSIVILDTPVYRAAQSGEEMLRARAERFQRNHGIASGGRRSEGYLTWDRLRQLEVECGLGWKVIWPLPRWRYGLRRLRTLAQGRRESAAFPILVGVAQDTPLAGSRPRSIVQRRIGRPLVRERYELFQRWRHRHLVLEQVGRWPIVVFPDVFNPKLFRTGAFLAETLSDRLIPPGAVVLDLGTGSGLGAIAAAAFADRVIATDLNPEAVRCARLNVLLNGVEDRVGLGQGDLFAPVARDRFEVVLFNPPFFRGVPGDAFDLAWRSTDVVERFAANLSDHLAPNGQALVVLSSDGETAAFLRAFRANRLAIEVVRSRHFLNETLTIYRLREQGG